MMMYKSYAKALLHVAENTNRKSTAHNTSCGLSTASGYAARQNAVGSVHKNTATYLGPKCPAVFRLAVSPPTIISCYLNPDY